jgi:hypothetical protein
MRMALIAVIFSISTLLSFAAQETTSPAAQDSHAVTIASQAVTAAGSMSAINAIEDYTATGEITYHLAHDVQGAVTVRGSGLDQIRIDANLPAGMRSQIISRGEITLRSEDGAIGQDGTQAPMAPTRLILPHLLLAPILHSSGYRISDQGLIAIDGHSSHDIQVQLVLPGRADEDELLREHHTVDFFIDASTYQVVMMQDFVSRHNIRQIRYSDYRLVNGVLVPFSIGESIRAQSTWLIHLDKITFNSGLTDSDFQP